jgi:hypothetical protein
VAETFNEYLSRVSSEHDARTAAAAQVVIGSVEDEPDALAGDLNLANDFAKFTGNPVPPAPLVKEYRNVFQQKIEEAKNGTVLSRSPKLSDWLRDPENAAVARDDLDNLSWFELVGKNIKEVAKGIPGGAVSAAGTSLEGAGQLLTPRDAADRLPLGTAISQAQSKTPEEIAALRTQIFNQGVINPQFAQSVLSDVLSGDMTPQDAMAAFEPMFAPALDAASKALQNAGETTQDYGGGILPADPGMEESFGREVGAGLGSLVTLIGASFLPGGIFTSAGVAASMGAGEATANARKAGQDEDTQTVAAMYGILPGLTDIIPMERLLANPATKAGLASFLRSIGTQTLLEGGQEAAQQTMQNTIAQVLYAPDKGILDDVMRSFQVGGVVGAISEVGKQVVMAALPGKFHKARASADRAADTVQKISEISAQANASKLRARLPDRFRQFLEGATAGSNIENVFIPAEDFVQYFQGAGIDPFALASELDGVTSDDLETALAGGGDLKIPTATYAAKIAGTDADPFFMENMRFDPNEFTAREAAEFNARADDVLQEAWEAAEAVRLEREELRSMEDQIYDSVVSRLRLAGRSTDVATNEAQLYAAFYRTMAERAGMSTADFMARYPLPEIRGDLPQGMQLKDTDALNRTLAEARNRRAVGAEKRGPTLAEWISDYGGINDVGGELKNMGAETVSRGKGKKTLRLARGGVVAGARDLFGATGGKKHGVDDVARAAIEAGYLANDPTANEYRAAMVEGREVPDIGPALWDAIAAEMRGDVQYATEADPTAAEHERMLDEIEGYLSSLGVSLNDDDATIRQAMEGAREYAQGGDVTQTEAFKRWFGDSKVVDENGRPLVVYHGSPDARSLTGDEGQFMSMGQRFGTGEPGEFFFTSDRRVAATYADDSRAFDYQNAEPAIVPTYLSIQNPMVLDWGGKTWHGTGAAIKSARDAGHDGVIVNNVRDAYQAGRVAKGDHVSSVFIAFEPTQIKSVNNSGTFDPADPRLLFQSGNLGPRGLIQFPPAGVGTGDTIIRLFQGADLSTFLHETGHYFLTVMRDMAEKGGNTDFDTVKSWWRENAKAVAADGNRVMPDVKITDADVIAALDTGTTGDVLKDAAVDVGMQEQFARGFEAYLMEGKAPSADLRGAFEKFRAWLISVYQKLAGLNVSISADLRNVFDRMIATDEEIANARADTGDSGPVFTTAEQMGLTQAEYDAFLKLRAQSEDEAKARLLRETMAPVKRAQEKWFKDERAKVREEVEAEINRLPYFRAIEWMGNRRWFGEDKPEDMADMRLSKSVLVDRYGEGVLKTLPRGKQTVYMVDGGLDPDDAAGWFGFGSGDEMVRAMERAPNRKEAIEAETDRVMRERHGDALNDGAIEAEAMDAVHTDKKAQWIAAELKAVVEIAGTGIGMTAKDARASAKSTIARMRVRDAMAANRFLAAERKAADEAQRLARMLGREGVWMANARRRIATKARAAMKGKGTVEAVPVQIERAVASSENYNETVAKLIETKRRQLINHALYTEARRVADEVEKAEGYINRLTSRSKREKIAGAGRRENASIDYLSAIDEILERYDFRKLSGKAEQRRGSLNAFVEGMKAAGRENEIAIPDAVLKEAARRPYKTLPVEELRGVIDSLKNLEHIALRWNKLIDAKNEREFEATVDEIAAEFEANMPKRPPGRVGTTGEGLRNSTRQFFNLVLNAGTILREIDGFKDLGAAYRNIKSPIDEAMNRLTVRKEKAAHDLEALYAPYPKDERRRMGVREHMPELGYALSKWERIAVALNTGNAGNLQRLTDKRVRGSLTETQVQAVLATLDARDADFIQSVWDYVGTFKDDIASRERRTTGVEPDWVEASPVVIAGKTLKGGYYPLKYDPRLSSLARDDEVQEIANTLQAGRFGKAQTRNGHTKERGQSSGRDVQLDMSVLHRHVNQVIYDLELSEPVSNAWRIIQSGKIRSAFSEAGRQADFDALEIWLKDVAEGELRSADLVGRTARMMKSNFTAAKLAFNLSTVAMQITGLSQTMVVVGKKDFANGIVKAFRPGVPDEIAAKSPFMATRQTTFNKDIYDFYTDPKSGPVATRWGEMKQEIIGPLSFWLMTKVQWHLVDVPTWVAGYQQGLRKFGNDEAKAIAHADSIVKRAQASGLFADRSAIERGSVTRTARQNDVVRLFTTLGSYMFAKFNVAYERTGKARRVFQDEGMNARSLQEALSWTLDMAFLFTVEAVIAAAIKGRLPDDDDEDDEGWLAFLAKETAFSVMGTIPGVRDVSGPLQGFDGGGAYGGITKEIAAPFSELGKSIEKGEVRRQFVKSVISATGLATGIPATQINRAVDAAWRQGEGDDVSPFEYFLGRMGK